jgi:hypothetical protein
MKRTLVLATILLCLFLSAASHARKADFSSPATTQPQTTKPGPPARARHALAFDRRAGAVLLYGGSQEGRQFDDLWQWDGQRWTEIKMTGPTPGKRDLHVMAYDAARNRTVLYGGTGEKVLDDTWEWDGKVWLQVALE